MRKIKVATVIREKIRKAIEEYSTAQDKAVGILVQAWKDTNWTRTKDNVRIFQSLVRAEGKSLKINVAHLLRLWRQKLRIKLRRTPQHRERKLRVSIAFGSERIRARLTADNAAQIITKLVGLFRQAGMLEILAGAVTRMTSIAKALQDTQR